MQLEPNDKQWDEIAVHTIKTLKSILGDDVIDIQHICRMPASLCNGGYGK